MPNQFIEGRTVTSIHGQRHIEGADNYLSRANLSDEITLRIGSINGSMAELPTVEAVNTDGEVRHVWIIAPGDRISFLGPLEEKDK